MKIGCPKHGCHFPQDFEQALKCQWWKDSGLIKLPKKYKRKVWDWLFALPSDEIMVATGYAVSVAVQAMKMQSNENMFAKSNPAYEKMSEKQQQDYQRKVFKKLYAKKK